MITLLFLLVLVYFHLLSRSNYDASQQKLCKWYQYSMTKYLELCQEIAFLFTDQNYYRGIQKLVMNSCPTPPSPPPFLTHGSVLSLVYLMLFVQSLHSITRAKLKYLSSQLYFYLACFRFSGSKAKHNSMNATWPKSPLFLVFALLLLSCHTLFYVSLQLFYLLNSWSRLYFIWQSTLPGQTWKSLDC